MASGGVQVGYSPAIAAGVTAQVHLAVNRAGADEIRFTREALGQWLVGACYSAELAAMSGQLRKPDDGTIGVAVDAAREAYTDGGTAKGDIIEGVPPRVAASWCYLATANIVKRIARDARRVREGADITHGVGDGESAPLPGGQIPVPLPGGSTSQIPVPGIPPLVIPGWPPVPGLPEDVPPLVIPGFGAFGAPAVPVGILALVAFAFAAAAAAYVARDALVASEVEATKRRDIEVAAQVKVASEVCAANAALGLPCNVPDVVRSLSKEEQQSLTFWKYGVPIVGVVTAAAGGAIIAKKKGWL